MSTLSSQELSADTPRRTDTSKRGLPDSQDIGRVESQTPQKARINPIYLQRNMEGIYTNVPANPDKPWGNNHVSTTIWLSASQPVDAFIAQRGYRAVHKTTIIIYFQLSRNEPNSMKTGALYMRRGK